jgi:hypothetical protein
VVVVVVLEYWDLTGGIVGSSGITLIPTGGTCHTEWSIGVEDVVLAGVLGVVGLRHHQGLHGGLDIRRSTGVLGD